MGSNRSLVSPTSSPALEKALRDKLGRRHAASGSLGELEPLAVRLGLMQASLKPALHSPQLLVFAADHGIAVDGICPAGTLPTHETVQALLSHRLPLTAFARAQQVGLTVVDCGMAQNAQAHERLLARKIAHGTRNARATAAMSLDQAHAGMRAGMEIGDKIAGNVTILAGIGEGSHVSAALVLARLTDSSVRDLLVSDPYMDATLLQHQMTVAAAAQARHRDITDPIEVLAAFGGYEVAVMVGVILMAASKRHLIMIDGMPACAALMLASRIAQPVTDYCVFCRSHGHRGLDQALNLFRASALLELGMDSIDGTGATLALPLMRSAAAMLTEMADTDEPTPSRLSALEDSLDMVRDEVPSPFGTALY
jgi:nicotinate-nucleotide--dimethylbenzimidazole phosphoribosyltransferase